MIEFTFDFVSAQPTDRSRDETMGRVPGSTAESRQRLDGQSGVSERVHQNTESVCVSADIRHRAGWRSYIKRLCFIYDRAIASRQKVTILQ